MNRCTENFSRPRGMDSLYTLENALKFEWASITGKLLTSRTSLLESQLLGSRILDAGCSGGGYSEFVARQNRRVVGIDKFGDFLNLAPRENRKAVYVQGDITPSVHQ